MSQIIVSPNEEQAEQGAPEIDEVKFGQMMHQLKAEQNLLMGFLGGLFAAIVAAFLWALITYFTGYQLGIAAIGVGILVGFAVRFFGKGFDTSFGILGAILALLGCLLGNFLTVIIFASQVEGVPLSEILAAFLVSPQFIISVFTETFRPMDLLFYGLAIYEGYKFSFRQVSEEEMASVQKIQTTPPIVQTTQQSETPPPGNV